MKILVQLAFLVGSLLAVDANACGRDAAICPDGRTLCPRDHQTCEWLCHLCPGRQDREVSSLLDVIQKTSLKLAASEKNPLN